MNLVRARAAAVAQGCGKGSMPRLRRRWWPSIRSAQRTVAWRCRSTIQRSPGHVQGQPICRYFQARPYARERRAGRAQARAGDGRPAVLRPEAWGTSRQTFNGYLTGIGGGRSEQAGSTCRRRAADGQASLVSDPDCSDRVEQGGRCRCPEAESRLVRTTSNTKGTGTLGTGAFFLLSDVYAPLGLVLE